MARRNYGTLDQAAQILTVSRQTVRRMIADGRLTGYRMAARAIRVDLDEVDALRPMKVTPIKPEKKRSGRGGGEAA
ncbi:MAG: helix-turn-helix domain-containing protein [Microlunatus sp.]